jgi:DNA replication and repair protein RecF
LKINQLGIVDFRNIEYADLELKTDKLALIGDNGQGKTNLLEAVHLLCVTRGFRTRRLNQFTRFAQTSFSISGSFATDIHGSRTGKVSSKSSKLIFELDGSPVSGAAEYFGAFPLVILSPESLEISSGGPGLRRRYLDRLISFSSKVYLELLRKYQRALKQRFSLLLLEGVSSKSLDVWENELAKCAFEIICRRSEFISSFYQLFKVIYQEKFAQTSLVNWRYKPSIDPDNSIESISRIYQKSREADLLRGYSTEGPHRDDIEFLLAEKNLRLYGSQGQHKLFLLCMALAEAEILQNLCAERPLLILDDLFAVLDDERIGLIAEAVSPETQILFSTTSHRHLEIFGNYDLQVVECSGGTYRDLS